MEMLSVLPDPIQQHLSLIRQAGNLIFLLLYDLPRRLELLVQSIVLLKRAFM
jgi:hypothetical protein